MTYEFDDFQIQIHAPIITVHQFIDNMDGTGLVSILLSLGASPNNTRFVVELEGFTYTGNPTHAEIEAWALLELVNYEV
jgi:hypothetical protein